MKKIKMHLYAHNFGILIPGQTGIVWEQQTEGVSCHHEQIEGIFIPLEEPYRVERVFGKMDWERINILDELANANYEYRDADSVFLWNEIEKDLKSRYGLVFKPIEEPKGMPYTQEGMRWVKITAIENEDYDGTHNAMSDLTPLINKTVLLIYPNSD